jgi:hypothetical protein
MFLFAVALLRGDLRLPEIHCGPNCHLAGMLTIVALLDIYGLYFSPNLTEVERNFFRDVFISWNVNWTVKTLPKGDSLGCK